MQSYLSLPSVVSVTFYNARTLVSLAFDLNRPENTKLRHHKLRGTKIYDQRLKPR